MKTSSQPPKTLAFAAILALLAMPLCTRAGENQKGGLENQKGGLKWLAGDQDGIRRVSVVSNNLNQNVYMLDTLADQMVFRYGWGLRSRKGDPGSVALHKYMKRHAVLTNALVKASRGKDPKVFKKAASDVRNSVAILQRLAKKADVGKSVSRMIANSAPLANFVCSNAGKFKAGPTLLPGKLFGKSKPVFQTGVTRSTPCFGLSFEGYRDRT